MIIYRVGVTEAATVVVMWPRRPHPWVSTCTDARPWRSQMRNDLARLLLAGCVAVLTAALGAGTALAAATWTITPGGAVTAKSGLAPITDTKVGKLMTCLSLTASGTLKSGSGLPGSGAGSLAAFGFHTCTNPFVSRRRTAFVLTATGLPWHLNLASYGNGVATGTISHMRITLTGPGCKAVIDGTGGTARDGHVRFRYSDATGRLTVLTAGSGLQFFDVMGCAGIINDGDPVTIGASFTVTPGQAITRP
jgi:hypothetical protein